MVSLTSATGSLTPASIRTSPLSRMPPPSSPATSILKSAKSAVKTTGTMNTAGKKRKIMEMDLSSSPPPSSDANTRDGSALKKRARVQFQPNVEMRPLTPPTSGDEHEKSVAVVREEVRRAIQRHVSGTDSEAYDRVKETFAINPKKVEEDGTVPYDAPTHTSLKRHLMGLLSNVAALDRSCSSLVHVVLNSEWLGRDESYVKLFIHFLGNLSAAQGGYLQSVLKMLVNYLGEVPGDTGKLPGYPSIRNSEIYSRTHMALRYVIELIPASSSILSPILFTQFPFDTDSAKANLAYTQNLIRVIDYAPELRSDILALIMEKLVKIDVQIQADMDDFEDEVGEGLVEDSSPPVAENDEVSDEESVTSDDDLVDADSRRLRAVRDNIHKVDSMIDVLFEFYTPPFANGTLEAKENTLDMLLSHFTSFILPTYRSRHSQFLLFHFAQSAPILVDRFATTCVEIIFSKVQPRLIRQSAAAYLASFVARGANVSSEVVRDVFDLLSSHLNNLRIEHEKTCLGPDTERYKLFYSTAQALLYIFCFRWRDLTTAALEEDDIDDLVPEEVAFPPLIYETLHSAIHSKLNPLKVCSPAIVSEFARLARYLQFMEVSGILAANQRKRVSSQLDAYFPFDPYQLPRSRRWLEGEYVEWRGIPDVDDRADEDSDSAVGDGYAENGDGYDDPTATDEED